MSRALKHMTPAELGERLGCSVATLAMWRCLGKGPRFIKFGASQQARVRYATADVEAWEAASMHENTGAIGA
jgi:predicted site-specific integrase-resolvase